MLPVQPHGRVVQGRNFKVYTFQTDGLKPEERFQQKSFPETLAPIGGQDPDILDRSEPATSGDALHGTDNPIGPDDQPGGLRDETGLMANDSDCFSTTAKMAEIRENEGIGLVLKRVVQHIGMQIENVIVPGLPGEFDGKPRWS